MPTSFPYINGSNDLFNNDKLEIIPHGEDVRAAIKKHTINTCIAKNKLTAIVVKLNSMYPVYIVAKHMDALKDVCFNYSTYSCVTFSLFDLPKYDEKNKYFSEAEKAISEIKELYFDGLLTDDERYVRTIGI
jgi:DNA-directed RNA polymerase subunit beta'